MPQSKEIAELPEQFSGFVNTERGDFHYVRWGKGKRLVLAFHGYGESCTSFNLLHPYLADTCTFYSFDLPHHGLSKWNANQLVQADDLKKLVNFVLDESAAQHCALIGYSMGGRVCLKIAELFPDKIESMTLLASDGLAKDFYYALFTENTFGKLLFKSFFKNPSFFLALIKGLNKVKLIDNSRYKFMMRYIGTHEGRELLKHCWPAMEPIQTDIAALAQQLNGKAIPIYLFMGRYDRIIPLKNAVRFRKYMIGAHLQIIEKGHLILRPDTAAAIAKTLM